MNKYLMKIIEKIELSDTVDNTKTDDFSEVSYQLQALNSIRGNDIRKALGLTNIPEVAKIGEYHRGQLSGEQLHKLKLYTLCVRTEEQFRDDVCRRLGLASPKDFNRYCKDTELQKEKGKDGLITLFDESTFSITYTTIPHYSRYFFDLLSNPVDLTNAICIRRLKLFAQYFHAFLISLSPQFPLPTFCGRIPSTPQMLYSALLDADEFSENIQNWTDVYQSKEKLNHENACFYLFGVRKTDMTEKTLSSTLQRLQNEWPRIRFDREWLYETKKDQKYDETIGLSNLAKKYVAPILMEALKYPLFRHYFAADKESKSKHSTHNPLSQMYEVRDLLRQITYLDSEGNVNIEPPVTAVITNIKKAASEFCMNQVFTSHDFLCMAGWVAEQAVSEKNHEIQQALKDLADPLDGDLRQCISDKQLFSVVAEVLYHSSFLITDYENGIKKFSVRSYRLVCAAYYAAYCLNQTHIHTANQKEKFWKKIESKLKPYLEKYKKATKELVVLGDSFYENSDAAVFFAAALAAFLDVSHRTEFIEKVCLLASDFCVENRAKQELMICILVNILVTYDIEISTALRKKMLECTFARTLYSFEISYWNCIMRTSKMYIDEVQKAMKSAIQLETFRNKLPDGTIETYQYAKSPPLYTFVCGNIGHENITDLNFWQKCSRGQYNTFSGKDQIRETERLLVEAKENFQPFVVNEEALPFALGLHMLGYALSDMKKNDPSHSFKKWYSNKEHVSAHDKLTMLIGADYLTRKTSREYNQDYVDFSKIWLLCGTHRVVCAYELEKKMAGIIKLTRQAANDYARWLFMEMQKVNETSEGEIPYNLRYVLLLSRLLSCTDFYSYYSKMPNLKQIIAKNRELLLEKEHQIFLPYDNFQGYIHG